MSCSGSTGCSMSSPVTFNSLDGTPIKYGSPGSYSQLNVRAESSFHSRLTNVIRYIKADASYYGGSAFGTLNFVGHAGAYVCKDGCHGKGRAFDMNYLQWNGYTLNIYGGAHASGTLSVRRRYLAVDAEVRYYMKYTLDGWYNSAHANHIHMDNHTAVVLSKSSSSDVKFVQAVCNNFNSAGLSIDGVWGTNTQNAWNAINTKWHYSTAKCNPFSSTLHYQIWLYLVIAHGFSNTAAGAWWANSTCAT